MVTLDMLRRLLDVAEVRRDPYAVAAVCAGLLETNPHDGRALGHYARALAALEMGSAARSVLELAAQAGGVSADGKEAFARLPAGVVPWTSRRRRFQANLRALHATGCGAEELERAWDDPAQKCAQRYALHQAGDGNFHILDSAEGIPLWQGWLGGLDNAVAAVAAIPAESFKNQLRSPLVFDGIGYGWLVPHVLQVSANSYLNYSAPLYIVEPDLIAFCMALHMQDLQAWLAGPRVRLFLGANARAQFLEALQSNPTWTLPGSVVVSPLRPRAALNLQSAVEGLLAQRMAERQAALKRIEAFYGAMDGAAWRKRYADAVAEAGAPLRVLGITTRYSTVLRYSMEELQAAAGACGIPMQMEVCMEPDDQSLEKDYVGMIDRLRPDLLVTISRMRHEMPDVPRNIPALCWDQDNLQCMRDPAALADMRGLTFVAGHGAVFGSMYLQWPAEACIFCHPAGRTHHYRPGAVTPEEERQYGADISYVSHASGLPEELRDQLRVKWRGGAAAYIPLYDASCDEVLASCRNGHSFESAELQTLIHTQAERLKVPLQDAVWHALQADLRLLVDRVFRHETLAWVAQWCESRHKRLRLWGNGWEKHPTLAKWAAGMALPGEQAMTVFRASAINLQIIETGVLHSRLLDGWAAGGFFLIRQAHRTQDEARMQQCHRIGQLAAGEKIETLEQLRGRGSAELQGLWQQVGAEYAACDPQRVFPGFEMWRNLVPAQIFIPQLAKLMFQSARGFAQLADQYCDSNAEKRAVVESVREVLDERLSYDARWRDFIGHIAAHVGYAVQSDEATK